MANDYIKRTNIPNVDNTLDQKTLATRFENMLESVANMIENDGPIYNVWISFQIGIDNPIIFNTTSTNPMENLIASLRYKKTGADVTNNFTLTIQYDPFKMGQVTDDRLEKLDEYVAKAMSYDFDAYDDTTTSELLGTLQYGYNSTSDSNLVTPKYTFYLTGASSDVRMDSGITTYTFEGTSIIATDCDNVVSFSKVEDENLLIVVGKVLYKWYGDENNKPSFLERSEVKNVEYIENPYKYKIDIPDELIDNCPKISKDAVTGMTPFDYCLSLLRENNLTLEEMEDPDYEDLTKYTYTQLPRYNMYFTDDKDNTTIHIVHIKPSKTKNYEGTVKATEKSGLSINYTITWGKQQKNLVVSWKPEVNLQLYLIRRAQYFRRKDYRKIIKESGEPLAEQQAALEKLNAINDDIIELYDAQIQLVGIPATPPISAEITIIPIVLESVSRTAGIYQIIDAEDNISTDGRYTTTISLFRVRNIDDETIKYKLSQLSTTQKAALAIGGSMIAVGKLIWDNSLGKYISKE